MKKLAYSATLAMAALAAPAANAAPIFQVNVTGVQAVNPALNEFAADLGLLGLTLLTTGGITLSEAAVIRFDFVGTESGFADTFFTVNGSTFTESTINVVNAFGAPTFIGTEIFGAGALNVSFSTNGNGTVANPGDAGFGVFLPTGTATGSFERGVLYFGYDDQITSPDDDNHDDLVIRATILSGVPEPSTWAFMLVGFGAVGYAMRRRPAYKMAQAV